MVSDPAQLVVDGPLLIAGLVAALAGLVSFLSPCVLPLVPGYLSYLAGLVGPERARPEADGGRASTGSHRTDRLIVGTRNRTRTPLAGAALFVVGFATVFVSFGAAFGGVGALLLQHADWITRVAGGVTVVLGLAFLGAFPVLQQERRWHVLRRGRLLGGWLLGVTFGLGWTPCLGPTLAAVSTLAVSEASATRGAVLGLAYCLGLGVPFLLLAGGAGWATRLSGLARRHTRTISRVGGGLLVLIGMSLITGWWSMAMIWLRSTTGGASFTPFGL